MVWLSQEWIFPFCDSLSEKSRRGILLFSEKGKTEVQAMKKNRRSAWIKTSVAALLLSGMMAGETFAANPNWYSDGKNWYYYKSNTEIAKDQWINTDGNWYSFDQSGRMQTGWVKRNDKYYYCLEDGSMATGWLKTGGNWYYLQGDGNCLIRGITPDNYIVGDTGAMLAGYRVIAGVRIQQPSLFVKQNSTAMGSWSAIMSVIDSVGQVAYVKTNGARTFHVYPDKISWCALSGSKETELLSLERVSGTSGYRIRIQTALDRSITDTANGAAYDYQILRMFCYGISSYAAQLDDILYTSFAGSNPAGIRNSQWVNVGDCRIMFTPAEGAGCFEIQPL